MDHDDEISNTAPMEKVFTVPAVAKLAGWSVSRMRRYLLAKHAELDGGLLVNVGRGSRRPRWTITLRALRLIAGPWFVDPGSTDRQIEWLAERLDTEQGEREILSRRVSLAHERLLLIAKAYGRPPVAARAR